MMKMRVLLALGIGLAWNLEAVSLAQAQTPTPTQSKAKAAAKSSAAVKTAWDAPTLSDWNSTWGLKGGGGRIPAIEPTPEYAPFLAAAKKAQKEGKEISSGVRCIPPGVPGGAGLPYGAEFVMQPNRKQLIILPEYGINRWIRIDGKHPDYVEPSYNGDAVAHWEGDTLVIDTIGITTKTILTDGARHSNKLHVIERWREIEPGVIENKIWMEDPRAFAKPVSWTVQYKKTPGEVILEHVCENNEEVNKLKNTFDAFEVMKEPEQQW